jgi:hypothetical protein
LARHLACIAQVQWHREDTTNIAVAVETEGAGDVPLRDNKQIKDLEQTISAFVDSEFDFRMQQIVIEKLKTTLVRVTHTIERG